MNIVCEKSEQDLDVELGTSPVAALGIVSDLVVSSHPDPVRDRSVLFLLLSENALGFESFVGRHFIRNLMQIEGYVVKCHPPGLTHPLLAEHQPALCSNWNGHLSCRVSGVHQVAQVALVPMLGAHPAAPALFLAQTPCCCAHY